MHTFRRGCLVALFGLFASWSPAQLTIQFDYSKDTNNFFGTTGSAQRNTLEAAATYLSSFLNAQSLAAITPTGTSTTGDRWNSSPLDPSTGVSFNIGTAGAPASAGASIAANTVVIYVGGYNLPTVNQIAYGSQGAWSWNGTAGWGNTVNYRGMAGSFYAPNLGSISFDTPTSWYFDNDITTVETFAGQYDFFSVAVHEMIHVLGQFDSAGYAWTSKISGSNFTGTNAVTEFGGNVPLTLDKDHWAEGTASYIAGTTPVANMVQEALMDPTFNFNVRKYITELDLAGLADMGYTTNNSAMLVNISAVPEPSTYALLVGVGVLAWTGWSRRRRS